MKHPALLMLASAAALGIATLQSSCSKTAAAASTEDKTAPENGAQFKKGEGL